MMFLFSAKDVINSDWHSNFPVSIYYNGQIVWAPIGSFTTTCDLDMFKFPFDIQECSLDFGNLVEADTTLKLSLIEEDVEMTFYKKSNEFE